MQQHSFSRSIPFHALDALDVLDAIDIIDVIDVIDVLDAIDVIDVQGAERTCVVSSTRPVHHI